MPEAAAKTPPTEVPIPSDLISQVKDTLHQVASERPHDIDALKFAEKSLDISLELAKNWLEPKEDGESITGKAVDVDKQRFRGRYDGAFNIVKVQPDTNIPVVTLLLMNSSTTTPSVEDAVLQKMGTLKPNHDYGQLYNYSEAERIDLDKTGSLAVRVPYPGKENVNVIVGLIGPTDVYLEVIGAKAIADLIK